MPGMADMPDVEYVRASDEHGRLILHDPGRALPLGSKVRLVPGHCDPTVNLYDWYVCYRNGRVEALWPITARGALLRPPRLGAPAPADPGTVPGVHFSVDNRADPGLRGIRSQVRAPLHSRLPRHRRRACCGPNDTGGVSA
jgi:hypothetical protein